MEQPLVSVVLCTFNGERYIREQVDSILTQTYSPFELIIADDASSDKTREILKQYNKDPRVSLLFNDTTMGLSKNFAFAASKAKGTLIAFSDQDDVWLPEKIEKLAKAIGHYPLVYSDSLLTDESGNSMHKKLSDLRKMYSGEDSRCYILYSCVWGHGMMVTRNLLQTSLPMPDAVHHDIWITYQAFLQGGIYYHDEILTHYRRHDSSFTSTLPQKLPARKKKERFLAYQKKLYWIRLMQQNEKEGSQPFYRKLLALYEQKQHSAYVFALISFMLRFRKEIFCLSKKNIVSQFIEILKQARGERE